jgi:hypothetical protein
VGHRGTIRPNEGVMVQDLQVLVDQEVLLLIRIKPAGWGEHMGIRVWALPLLRMGIIRPIFRLEHSQDRKQLVSNQDLFRGRLPLIRNRNILQWDRGHIPRTVLRQHTGVLNRTFMVTVVNPVHRLGDMGLHRLRLINNNDTDSLRHIPSKEHTSCR